MIVPGAPSLLIAAMIRAGTYSIEHSIRFNPTFSTYAMRRFTLAGNSRTMTLAFWFKLDKLGSGTIFGAPVVSGTSEQTIRFSNGYLQLWDSSTSTVLAQAASQISDTKYWHHGCIGIDTTQAVAGNRVMMEIDNAVQSISVNNLALNQLLAINQATTHSIGRQATINAEPFSGYLADMYFLSGVKARAAEFVTGSGPNATYPQPYSRKYPFGVNGFFLPFTSGYYVDIGSGITTYSSPGTYSITVPAGYTVQYQLLGGGGGGSGSRTNNFRGYRNDGVGGGASTVISGSVDITSASTLTLVVGAGGAGGAGSSGDSAPDNYPGGNGGTTGLYNAAVLINSSVGGAGGAGLGAPQGASSTMGAGGAGEVVGGLGAGGGGGLQYNDPVDWGGPGAAGGSGYARIVVARTSASIQYSTYAGNAAKSIPIPSGYTASVTIIAAGGGGGAPEWGTDNTAAGGGSGGYVTISGVEGGVTLSGITGAGGTGGAPAAGTGDKGGKGGATTISIPVAGNARQLGTRWVYENASVSDTLLGFQCFDLKLQNGNWYYKLYDAVGFTQWTGSPTPWSTMTYGTRWSTQGEAIRITSISYNASTGAVTVGIDVYDKASNGSRWQGAYNTNLATWASVGAFEDYIAYGGDGGAGAYGLYAQGVGGQPGGTTGGARVADTRGGLGADSFYTTLFGTPTGGTAGLAHTSRDGGAGTYGAGGGGAAGSTSDGALGAGGKGGDGVIIVALSRKIVATTTQLFDDASGMANHFSGVNAYREATYRECWMKDTPTKNFPILDYSLAPQPTEKTLSISNGGLDFTNTGSGVATYSQGTTLAYLSGKQYIEFGVRAGYLAYPKLLLIDSRTRTVLATIPTANLILNDVLGVAINFNTGQYWTRLNTPSWGAGNPVTGASPTGTFTVTPTGVTLGVSCDGGALGWINTGQRDYVNAAPTGFDTGVPGPRPAAS